jgi:hypothetical protein
MAASLTTLELFRPSILDPVEDAVAHDRHSAFVRDTPVAPAGLRPAGFRHVQRDRLRGTGDGAIVPGTGRFGPGDEDRVRDNASDTGGGRTLDDLLVGVWEGLSAHRTVACPACGEAMTPRYGAGPAPVGGRCTGCRTTIA